MSTFDLNNPKLTAYALGELDDVEKAIIESHLREDESLRAEVEAIRRTAQLLERELAAEPSPGLTSEQREFVQRRPEPVMPLPFIFRARTIWISTGLAAAACLMIVAILTWSGGNSAERNVVAFTKDDKSVREIDALTVGEPAPIEKSDGTFDLEFSRSNGIPGSLFSESNGANLADSGRSASREAESMVGYLSSGASPDTEGGGFGGGRGGAGSSAPPPAATSAPARPDIAPPPRLRVATGVDFGESARRESRAKAELKREDETRAIAGQPALANDPTDRAGAQPEQSQPIADNPFLPATGEPSTFSIDVDTASYSNIRQSINAGELPPKEAVRIEEMINYFSYQDDPPTGEAPFSANVEVNAAPWKQEHRLVRIGLRGKDVRPDMRPPTNLVFLVDVSGSMNQPKKLPLVQESLKHLVNEFNSDDRLSIVTYAGDAGIVQEPVYCTYVNKPEIQKKIEGLRAGGSTNGAGGIHVAYDLAANSYIKGGVNRVLLCTDGDFNVGASTESELVNLIQQKRSTGVYLSVLGFGSDNWQDAKMKQLAMHGNGNFAYIDRIEEGRKALVEQMSGTLVTIAKDVKVQVEFNPALVKEYRLIGYENRVMDAADFSNDRVDAGEIGAGHSVTALYELIMQDEPPAENADEALLTLRLRYKQPDEDESTAMEFPVQDRGAQLESASGDFKFAAAVAAFGMILRDSPHRAGADIPLVLDLARSSFAESAADRIQSRHEFVELVQTAAGSLEQRPRPADH